MKFAGAFSVAAIAVMLCGGRGECTASGAPAADAPQGSQSLTMSADDRGRGVRQTIPDTAAWEYGFPIPAGARRNDALGGATSLAPGKNYTLTVYDVDLPADVVAAFYAHHLHAAARETAGPETRFSAPGGQVRLVLLGHGTRITLVIGPR